MEIKRPNQCAVDGCELDRYEEHDKCILHCDKIKNTNYPDFDRAFFSFCEQYDFSISKTIFFDALHFPHTPTYKFKRFDQETTFIFNNCHFLGAPFFLNISNVSYNKCIYMDAVIIYTDPNHFIKFSSCVFNDYFIVSTPISFDKSSLPTIKSCTFNFYTFFNNIEFKESYFSLSSENQFKYIIIQNGIISENIELIYFELLQIENTILNRNLTLAPKNPVNIHIESSQFNGFFNINSKSHILSCTIKNTIFNGSVNLSKLDLNKTVFNNITFNANLNMSYSTLGTGFDFVSCSFSENTNFSMTKLDNNFQYSRETYRIIKNSFDQVGNSIEANKYFALEMKAYERELKENGGTKSERFLLWVNRATSDYGQNFVRPILILVFFNLFLAFNVFIYKNANQEVFNSKFLSWISDFLNTFAGLILPFKEFLIKGHDFLTLIITIINGVLIYQTIVALKRKTRR